MLCPLMVETIYKELFLYISSKSVAGRVFGINFNHTWFTKTYQCLFQVSSLILVSRGTLVHSNWEIIFDIMTKVVQALFHLWKIFHLPNLWHNMHNYKIINKWEFFYGSQNTFDIPTNCDWQNIRLRKNR